MRLHKELAICAILLLSLLGSGSAVAKENNSCNSLREIAQAIVSDQITPEVQRCFDNLATDKKASVFEEMATLRGIDVEKLRAEVRNNRKGAESPAVGVMSGWNHNIHQDQTIIWETSSDYGTPSYTCDGDPSDLDYVFQHYFYLNVPNDATIESAGKSAGVIAMLAYYESANNGVIAYGDYGSRYVNTCLGENGVWAAGGPVAVGGNLYLAD